MNSVKIRIIGNLKIMVLFIKVPTVVTETLNNNFLLQMARMDGVKN